MSESIWKKEVTLRRKSKAAPEPKPVKESVWKKEISLSRKPKTAKSQGGAKRDREPMTTFEFDLARAARIAESSQQPQVAQDSAPHFESSSALPQPQVVAAEPAPRAVVVEAGEAAEPAEPQGPKPETSIWKKEIGFRRKRAADEVQPAQIDLAPEASAAPAPPAMPQPAEPETPPTSVWKKEISFRRKRAADEIPQARIDLALGAGAGLEKPVEAEPVDVVPPPVVETELKAAEPVLEPEQPVLPVTAAPADDVLLPLEHVTEQPSSVLDFEPDVPVDAEQVRPGDAWLARAEYPAELEPAQADDAPIADAVPDQQAEAEKAPEPKTSFWRKERSLKRAPKPELAVALEPKQKKLSLKRTPKEPKLGSGDSFLRRERSLTKPKMSVPKRASGAAGGSGSHAVKRYVGLKVGSSQIAAARVSNNGAAELLQVAREPLAHGVVVNGELRDPEALAEALKRFFARNKLPRKNVRLGIASSRIGVRVFDIAGIEDDKQLENAIRFRAQDTLPIPLDEAVLDYHILGESVDEQGNPARRVLLVVAYRDLVDRYVAACRKAGISLVGIDLEAFALLRALAAPKAAGETSDAAFVAVAIGHDRSTFAVSDGRVCEFTRVIEWGGASLSVAIARVLDMAPSEVESIKRLVSLESDTVPEGVEAADYTRAAEAVHRQVQGFARELVSSLQFYQGQPGSLGIGEIVITGGTANLAGLAGELERQIGVHVRVGDPLARLKVGKKISADEQIGSLAVAIGLGIED